MAVAGTCYPKRNDSKKVDNHLLGSMNMFSRRACAFLYLAIIIGGLIAFQKRPLSFPLGGWAILPVVIIKAVLNPFGLWNTTAALVLNPILILWLIAVMGFYFGGSACLVLLILLDLAAPRVLSKYPGVVARAVAAYALFVIIGLAVSRLSNCEDPFPFNYGWYCAPSLMFIISLAQILMQRKTKAQPAALGHRNGEAER